MTCRDCGRPMRPHHHRTDGHTVGHRARGLCDRCYRTRTLDGTLHDVERLTRARHELLEDWALLREQGYPPRQIADRLGITYSGLTKALQRARAAA